MRIAFISIAASVLFAGAAGCDDDEPEVAPAAAPLVCPPGRGDCDEDPANGCEADLRSSLEACGRCSGYCQPGQRCVEGECRGARVAAGVCAGESHVCATGDTRVHCWGHGDPQPRRIGSSWVPLSLSCGRDWTCLLRGGGSVACWDAPVPEGAQATDVPGLDDVVRLVMGADEACALRADGSVHCWSRDERPRPLSGLRDVISLSAAGQDACALTTEGSILCWKLDDESAPQRVAVEDPVEVVARDGGGCALDQAGRVYCWGDAGAGAIGDGTGEARPEPTRVLGLEGVTGIVRIGARTLCASGEGGRRCWGDDRMGQLGGEGGEVLAPVESASVGSTISAGFGISCGEDLAGAVFCWGDNRQRVIDSDEEIVRAAGVIEGLPRSRRNPY